MSTKNLSSENLVSSRGQSTRPDDLTQVATSPPEPIPRTVLYEEHENQRILYEDTISRQAESGKCEREKLSSVHNKLDKMQSEVDSLKAQLDESKKKLDFVDRRMRAVDQEFDELMNHLNEQGKVVLVNDILDSFILFLAPSDSGA